MFPKGLFIFYTKSLTGVFQKYDLNYFCSTDDTQLYKSVSPADVKTLISFLGNFMKIVKICMIENRL